MHYLIIIFSSNTSIEVLNLLFLISKKYQFLKLRRSENPNLNTDLESSFVLNSSSENPKLLISDACFFLWVNTRFEGSYLNLKLRQRYLKGNFSAFSLGSKINLTYPVCYMGSSTKILKAFVEGNNLICQNFKSASSPILVCGVENFHRKDAKTILDLLEILKLNTNFSTKNWNGINFLNSTLNDVGSKGLNSF